ncbi:MAG: hypothetical protein KDD02_02695 [Phaeodactylibacter sp.]|nr:hypothetical protein [Phaeodactylibacter sp.]MCB9302481.1 hypothetical protein [Lewinellaceae bacterium]
MHAQSRVDSLISEVEALNKNYQERLTELYHQMVALRGDKNLPAEERIKAEGALWYFPIQENMDKLLDSIGYEVLSLDDNYAEGFPYRLNINKMIYKNEKFFPAIMSQAVKSLEKAKTSEELLQYSFVFKSYFYYMGIPRMREEDKAECLRIMAKWTEPIQKENLLKIADMLEQR